jgi:hypothetical protein
MLLIGVGNCDLRMLVYKAACIVYFVMDDQIEIVLGRMRRDLIK